MTVEDVQALAKEVGLSQEELLQEALNYIVDTDNGSEFRDWICCNRKSDPPSEGAPSS